MKTQTIRHALVAGFCLLHSAICLSSFAQGTAFTYQGRLNSGSNTATGSYDLTFTLFTKVTSGLVVGGPITNAATGVSNGLFTVTLDFGNVFPGPARWLEIAVQTNGGGSFTTLAPRQPLTPTPYAIFAGGASNLVGAVSSANLAGAYLQAVTLSNPGNVFAGDGTSVTNVNAMTLNGLGSGAFWRLGGNNVSPGQFLGSTNNQAVEFKVNGLRALRLEQGFLAVPNVIGGASVNYVSSGVGAVIAGGGADNYFGLSYTNGIIGSFGFIGGGGHNTIGSADFSVLGGGQDNSIQNNDHHSFLGGGQANTIGANSWVAVLGGGEQNFIQGSYNTFLGGGYHNSISNNAHYATLGGGSYNVINNGALYATISGGNYHSIGVNGVSSTIGGGYNNSVGSDSSYSTVVGGSQNAINGSASYNLIGGGNQNEVSFGSTASVIGGGANNTIFFYSTNSVIGGGAGNFASGFGETIGGGIQNTASGALATVGGGTANFADGNWAAVGGGYNNLSESEYGTVAGGYVNRGYGVASTVGGGYNNSAAGSYSTVSGGTGNQAMSFNSTIGGGSNNIARRQGAVISGGAENEITNTFATIGGGLKNFVGSPNSVISGGQSNFIAGSLPALNIFGGGGFGGFGGFSQLTSSTIGGGTGNRIYGIQSFIGGGGDNVVSDDYATIGGGSSNTNLSYGGTIGGGIQNRTIGSFGTIPGGESNTATNHAFAAGNRAKAIHAGAFVWADTTAADIVSTVNDSVTMRASGGYRLFSNGATNAGVSLAASGTAWAVISDRNVKKDFTAVDSVSILEKLAAMPITQWHYNWEEQTVTPHIGPMAQDFKHAFYPGSDDKTISTLEADGVAFAAIQGLNQKLEAQRAQLQAKDAELEKLKASVEALRQLVLQQGRSE